VKPPTGREVDGVYLDENEKEIMKEIDKWKQEWPTYGVTIMCDSWTGPTRMSVINLEQWAGENVGDTHLGKRKTKVLRPGSPEKKGKMIRSPQEEELASNETTPEPSGGGGGEGNTDDDDDDDDDNDDGGSGYPVSSQAGGRSARSMPVLCTLVSMHYEVCMNYALFCFCEL